MLFEEHSTLLLHKRRPLPSLGSVEVWVQAAPRCWNMCKTCHGIGILHVWQRTEASHMRRLKQMVAHYRLCFAVWSLLKDCPKERQHGEY